MPTALSHAFTGALLAPLAPTAVRPAKAALLLAALAVAPDLDVVGFWLGVSYSHPLGHRGLSHSLPAAAAAGWLLSRAAFPELAQRRRDRTGMALLLFVAMGSHGLLDAATDGGRGIGLLLPFSERRFFLPWRPLPVSPLEPAAFFGPRGLAVLRAEAWWLGVPGVAVGIAAVLARRRRAAPPRSAP